MKTTLTLFILLLSLNGFTQKLSISDAKNYEGASLKFTLSLDQAVGPFVVKVTFDDIEASGAAAKQRKRKDESNDYINHAQNIAFDGVAGETHDFYVRTLADNNEAEGEEKFKVNIQIENTSKTIDDTDVGIGIIEDLSCRYCPPSTFLNQTEQFKIDFFGDGSLQNSLDKGSDIAANTGVGVVASKHFKNLPDQKFLWWYRVDLMATINVASTVDTLIADLDGVNIGNQRAFGSSLLTPLSTGDAVNLRLLLYNKKSLAGILSGVEFQYLGANRNWRLDSANIFNVNTSFLKLTLFHDFVNYEKRDDFTLMFKLGYTHHWVGGDLADNRTDLSRFLGSGRRRYDGLDLGLRFKLKNLHADFSYVQFFSGDSVPGLTGGRLITTITFVGGFGLKLKD